MTLSLASLPHQNTIKRQKTQTPAAQLATNCLRKVTKPSSLAMTLRKGKNRKKINGTDYGTTSQEEDLDSQLQRVSASAHEADIVQEKLYLGTCPKQLNKQSRKQTPGQRLLQSVVQQKNTPSSSARPSVSKPAVGKLFGAQRTRKQVFYLGGIVPECSVGGY